MSRAARLLELMQVLRRHRRPVSGQDLAAELGVSIRSLYRDIATLRGQGADIEGEPGFGYVLRPGHFLPPLMFSDDEIDAIILGLRFVARRGDDTLVAAAADAIAKIEAVLPEGRDGAAANGLLAGPAGSGEAALIAGIRAAIAAEEKLFISYVDKKGAASQRTVWPVVIGFFQGYEVLAAWCEARSDFRHFRLDRVRSLAATGQRMPRRHRVLLAEWRLDQDLDELI